MKTSVTIQKILLSWYNKHQRDLPWRYTRDPYKIVVSEVMLQQTQVDRVIIKYQEFLKKFPTTQVLAQASPAAVISAWAGLGYNRRALFLQKTAQAIENEYGGEFPRELEALKKLPGVGDYTARAILSFAFEQPVPMMDTNHRRIYQRVLIGLKEKKDAELLLAAEEILPKKQAYDWNQALMDFGSLVCLKRTPQCNMCPLQQFCKAYPKILDVVPQKKARLSVGRKIKPKLPFIQTNRYVRGRLIAELRDHTQLSFVQFLKKYPDVSKQRLEKAYTELKADGLIIGSKRAMMLPS